MNELFSITPTTPANLSFGLFRNYLNNVARSKRECDKNKKLEISSIKTYASCANCFINRVARDRPLNKVLHEKFLKRVEKSDRNGALKKVIQMDRNGLKIFKEFYESHCKGKYPDSELYVDDPDLKIIEPDTIVFQRHTTEQVLYQNIRNNFAIAHRPENISIEQLYEILQKYDSYRQEILNHHFYSSYGIDMEVVLANIDEAEV
jgi:hypothetical protein